MTDAPTTTSGSTDGQVLLLLQPVLHNQDEDHGTTRSILDTLVNRMADHEATTRTLLTRLQGQEERHRIANEKNEERFAKMNDWGANITVQIHNLNTSIQHIEEREQAPHHDTHALQERLRSLEERQLQQSTTAVEAARRAATAAATEHLQRHSPTDLPTRPTAPASRPGTDQGLTLIIAGFGTDQPCEVVERTCRRLLRLTSTCTRLGFLIGTGGAQQTVWPARPATAGSKGQSKGASSSSHSAPASLPGATRPQPTRPRCAHATPQRGSYSASSKPCSHARSCYHSAMARTRRRTAYGPES